MTEDKPKLTTKTEVLGLIKQGKANAVTGQTVADTLNMDKRSVQVMVNALRRDGFPVLSSSDTKCAGYFLSYNEQEIDEFIATMKHRQFEIGQTIQAVEIAKARITGR